MADILQEISKNSGEIYAKKERLQKAEHDFFYFCKTYLPHYFSSSPAEYHKVLTDVANRGSLTEEQIAKIKPLIKNEYHSYLIPTEKARGIIDIEPRGFSKSTRWALAYPLWSVLFKKRNFLCIFCASQSMANSSIQSIKDEIEGNDLIFEDFGAMEGAIWKSDFLTFKNETAIKGFGSSSSVRGVKFRQHRPDLIICDDILKEDNARTFAGREKIARWFYRAVVPLGQDALIVMINTLFHSGDLPSKLLERIAKKDLPDWLGFRFAAITPLGESLWKEYWTAEKLAIKKREVGSNTFSTEYMNEPLSDEERVFKQEWFSFYSYIDISTLRIFMGVDPSTGRHDEFAIVTIGVAPDGTIYVLNEWAACVSVAEATKTLITSALLFKPLLIGFEEVGFQSIYKEHIMKEAAASGVYLPIKGLSTRGVGKERILQLSPLIENGFLKFKEGKTRTIDQLTMYPKSEYDDLQDALFYAFEISQNRNGSVFAFNLQMAPSRLQSVLNQFKKR